MNDFYTKWKEDKKYRTKIKLIAYTCFVVVVSIYAISINQNISNDNSIYQKNDEFSVINNESDIIDIPKNYTYKINVIIDDENYSYSGKKSNDEETITKEDSNGITNYRYFDNEYYILIDDIYQKTTKEEIYDVVSYNYINVTNINKYLSKAEKKDNNYLVYLKDVILGNDSNDYFTITINNNHISIDYIPLIQVFNPNIKKYNVDIQIENNE